jgi:uncharacterized protein YsxB (DUF464 family)
MLSSKDRTKKKYFNKDSDVVCLNISKLVINVLNYSFALKRINRMDEIKHKVLNNTDKAG